MKRFILLAFAAVGFLLMSFYGSTALAVEQWSRFEQSFTSSKDYYNPAQQIKLNVEFTSPRGNKRTLPGFWDGGRSWRVRFSPDEQGGWTYKTTCTDQSNKGLNNRTGSFQCVKNNSELPLFRHGELRLSANKRYIEHNDGTPFFWLADTVWCGPLFADLDDWKVFLKDRVEKEFTAIQFVMTQWRAAPGDADGTPAFTGTERVRVLPAFFQRMDRRVDAVNERGLLASPVLLWAIRGEENPGYYLPEDQKIVLAEYMVARYGAHQVIWMLGGDGEYRKERAETWRKVGRAVFREDHHQLEQYPFSPGIR